MEIFMIHLNVQIAGTNESCQQKVRPGDVTSSYFETHKKTIDKTNLCVKDLKDHIQLASGAKPITLTYNKRPLRDTELIQKLFRRHAKIDVEIQEAKEPKK
jgi:hypothetical protein